MAKQYQEFEVDDYTTIFLKQTTMMSLLMLLIFYVFLTSMNSDALKRTGVLSVNAQS